MLTKSHKQTGHDKVTVTTLQRFVLLLKVSDTKRSSFIVPALMALIAAIAEGLTFTFLIPTIKSMIDHNYHPYFSLPMPIRETFPSLEFLTKNQAIALCLVSTFTFALVKIVLAYFAGLSTAKSLKLFAAKLRSRLYERYLSFGKLFFDRSNIGHLQQILTTYVSLISSSLGSIQISMYAAATLLIYLAIMLYISPKLTIIVLLAFPILHFSLRWLVRRIDQISQHHTRTYNKLVRGISNSLSTISLVKASSKESEEKQRFEKLANEVGTLEYSIERNSLMIGPIQEIILLCFLFLLVGLVALVLAKGAPVAMANYAVYFVILKRAATMFGVFAAISAALAAVSGPIAETAEILGDHDKFFIPDGASEFIGLREKIEFNQLEYHYPQGMTALNGVDFEMKRGQTLAIVGQSGSGKSTLIHLLMRFYDPPPGSIMVDGHDVRSFTIKSWLSHIALVSQDTLLFNATLRENLTYGLLRNVSEEELLNVLRLSRLDDVVEQLPLGVETEVGDHGVMLSGGERQRVSIARAILKGADILLLDEATSALDSRTEKLVQLALDDLAKGKTTLVVAHRLSTVKAADHVIVLEAGSIVEQGSVKELLESKGALAAYWNEQRLS